MTCVVLKRPHTHVGKQFAAGERLDVPVAVARWLVDHSIADLVDTSTNSDPVIKPFNRKDQKK